MKFWYDSPEALKRQAAAASLKSNLDAQMDLFKKMRGGDGRTTKYREMYDKAKLLEGNIQACIAAIIDPK